MPDQLRSEFWGSAGVEASVFVFYGVLEDVCFYPDIEIVGFIGSEGYPVKVYDKAPLVSGEAESGVGELFIDDIVIGRTLYIPERGEFYVSTDTEGGYFGTETAEGISCVGIVGIEVERPGLFKM